MFRRFSANFAVFSMYLDFLLIGTTLLLAVEARPLLNGISFVKSVTGRVSLPWFLYLVFPLLWVAVLIVFSLYDGRKNLRAVDELGSLALGSCLATISMAGVLYLSYRDVSRFLFFSFVLAGFALMAAWRIGYRSAMRLKPLNRFRSRRVLILGAGSIGQRLAEQIREQPNAGLTLAGFLDDDTDKQNDRTRVLGKLHEVHEIVMRQEIEDVVIALPRSADTKLNRVVSDLHDLPVRVWIIPDYFSLTLHKASVEEFAGIPMLDLRAPALTEYQRIGKRAFDLVVSGLMIPFLLPVMGVVAMLIRLDSGGPVLYRAKRVGENGKLFMMHKFRTMVQGADRMVNQPFYLDELGRPVYKTPNDPRITRFGAFLRKTSLDELPQIWNVIRGEMSLVGPRPELPTLVEKYAPWQRKRFTVPQGITGWWQVHERSDKPMHLHTEEDLYYVQNYSIWLDFQILMKTLSAVLRGKGAY
ncbi:MAG: sugar transferase [Anaerolineaceae bacterium]|nr:sugar transferase [Anaerolineaceae bacterium]